MGHKISERTVNHLLHEMGYSLQGNQKTLEGKQNPDRDQQFRHIEGKSRKFLKKNEPVISVDTKKRNWWDSTKIGGTNGIRKEIPN